MVILQDYTDQPDETSVATGKTSEIRPKRLLIVEDDALLAFLLEELLADMNYESLAASNVVNAMALFETEIFDGAILDVNLAGETIYPVVAALNDRNIPFIFSTGSGTNSILGAYRSYPTLVKPYSAQDLQRQLCVIFPNSETR